ncbi:MAG: hypothetical protein AAFU78_22010, partial [Cyanobacteria bacterium J06633_2]
LLALAITIFLGIEFGYISSSMSLILPEETSPMIEQTLDRVLASSDHSSDKKYIQCQSRQTPRYRPTDVGLPSRREGGGTR